MESLIFLRTSVFTLLFIFPILARTESMIRRRFSRAIPARKIRRKGADEPVYVAVLVIDKQCFNAVFCGLVRNLKKMNKNRGLGWENKLVWKKFMRFARMGIIPCPLHLAKGVWKASGGVKPRYSYRPTNNQTPNSQINQLPLGYEKIAHRHPDI
jgi:hypothetical protein